MIFQVNSVDLSPRAKKNMNIQTQRLNNPSFSGFNVAKIRQGADEFVKANFAQKEKTVPEIFREELAKINNMISDSDALEQNKSLYSHELRNVFNNALFDLGFDKTKSLNMIVSNIADFMKLSAKHWDNIDKMSKNPLEVAEVSKITKIIDDTVKSYPGAKLEVFNKGLLSQKQVKNPAQFYNLVSQVVYNGVKYGDGKPVIVKFDSINKDGKNQIYMSVINEKTTPVPDVEIDEIIKGTGYRAEGAKASEIKGTGTGISEVVSIMAKNGFIDDIPNLFEKGRAKGVHVRIPLIGVE